MNNIIFKGYKDRLTVWFDNEQNFEQVKNDFSSKLKISQKFFEGAKKTSIEFKGRPLTDNQKFDLLNIFSSETGIDISLVNDAPQEKKSKQEKNSDMESIFQKNSLRSGQFIHYKGNVILIGDVNPGAEIIAGGNIIVMGTIKGLVHAGCYGDKNCIIAALGMLPVQLRIANIITCMPDNEIINRPSHAYIKDEKLYISPLQ